MASDQRPRGYSFEHRTFFAVEIRLLSDILKFSCDNDSPTVCCWQGEIILQGPETRASLIASLNQPASEEAWTEFAAIYRPLIIRVAIAKGLQHADAEDLAQETMAIVGRSISSFNPNAAGSFRGWLRTITRNLVVNHLTRGKEPTGSGDSNVQAMLDQLPTPDGPTATLFDFELRRAQFQIAAAAVRVQVNETTWDAFRLTAIERLPIANVAQQLGKSDGAVRMARCRVMTRLREEVKRTRSKDVQQNNNVNE